MTNTSPQAAYEWPQSISPKEDDSCSSERAAVTPSPDAAAVMTRSTLSFRSTHQATTTTPSNGGGAGNMLEKIRLLRHRVKTLPPHKRSRLALFYKLFVMPWVVVFLLGTFLTIISLIYFLVLWDPLLHLDKMTIAVVCADQDRVLHTTNQTINLGATLTRMMTSTTALSWRMEANTTTLEQLRTMVHHDDAWAAVWIPSDLSSTWASAFEGQTANLSSITYANSVLFIQDPAKQMPTASTVEKTVQAIFAGMTTAIQKAIYAGKYGIHGPHTPADAVFQPVTLKTVSIHPMTHSGWWAAQYIPLMFQYVATLLPALICCVVFKRQITYHLRLPFVLVLALRLGETIVITGIVCAIHMGILAAYGMPVAHSHAVVWLSLWLMSFAWSGLVFPAFTVFGQDLVSITATVIIYFSMVTSGAMYSPHLLTSSWGIGTPVLPLSHGIGLLSWAMNDVTPNKVGGHIGALFVWGIIGFVVSILPQWYGWHDRKPLPPAASFTTVATAVAAEPKQSMTQEVEMEEKKPTAATIHQGQSNTDGQVSLPGTPDKTEEATNFT